MNFSESELISEIKKRNLNAYESLIKEYTKPVYYLTYNILNIGNSKEDIEECVADVFLEVWLKINGFDSERSNFKTWVLIITKYKALTYKRKLKKNHVENIDDYQLEESDTVERQIIDRETQKKLLEIINSFNKTDKELFIRRYFYNEKISDIMQSLGLSRSALDNRLLRGRKIIKEVLSYD
ncbi:RNA polymerase, sigma-24 subunit, ECF subfamily [Desulfofarcimen acetoxidans DSM 771]|uniref:RNA polymerase, sigma-24 subunit, ECF subfamily n=1 Tax=Desulfofarcimen acetoxidans (strain ATCC 49208 / DSM 771 / KCTC 5769 / VKM B-1644 / 5575) TaxID=485916 RepID=C8W519_DESAS|nr:sigma-70 family RNA polymerase sigma factor [Desulfofarcimen acetoxidans]ACV61371.1 RNA polymerase, sigma-24 subunit, ECF subfamily [Desulfofarcimen acetoxidans DSM 771]